MLALDPLDKIINQNIQRFLVGSLSPLAEIIVSQEGTSGGVEECQEDGQCQQAQGLHSDICKAIRTETSRNIRLALQIDTPESEC